MTWNNSEIESIVIGELLYSDDKAHLVNYIAEDDFTNKHRREVVRAMQSMYADTKHLDVATLGDRISEQAHNAVISAMNTAVGNYKLDEHIKILKDYTTRRNIAHLSKSMIEQAADKDADPTGLCHDIINRLKEIMPGETRDESMRSVLMETHTHISALASGKVKPTTIGIPDFDNVTGGIFDGELTIIGARPSVGKSAFAQHIATQFAQQGKTVEFFSREMSRIQYGARMLAAGSGIKGSKLRAGRLEPDEFVKVTKAMGKIAGLPIYINTTARTMAEVMAVCHERKQNNGLGLVVVDYMQLLHSKGASREQEVSAISRGLKDLTLEFNIPVIALSQLNRDVQNKTPTLSNLRESGAIEQDADNVLLLHNEGEKTHDGQHLRLIIAKQRQGNTGYVDIMFRPESMQFSGLCRDEPTAHQRNSTGVYVGDFTEIE
jgi:replicative DNA helicase